MDEVSKSKRTRTRKRVRNLERLHESSNHPLPGHEAAADSNCIADGFNAEMHADETKSARDMAASATAGRAGAPVTAAGFNAQRTGTSSRVAVAHPDLRQSNTDFSEVLARLSTRRGNVLDLDVSDSTPGGFSHAGEVALGLFDSAGLSGSFAGMMPVSGDPQRPAEHPASTGANNGSHSLSNPVSHAVRSKVQQMREMLFPDD